MNGDITSATVYAKSEGYDNPPPPEYRTSTVVELPYMLIRGCRTFVALDSTGLVVARGLLEDGGDMAGLLEDLRQILRIIDPSVENVRPRPLALVAD